MDGSKRELEQCLLMDPTNLLPPKRNTTYKTKKCFATIVVYFSVTYNALFS